MSPRLPDTAALVTGAASGLGAAITERFLAEGASVLALDRDTSAIAPRERLVTYEADVRDGAALADAVGVCEERFGGLDVLVPNAGIWDYQRRLTRLSAAELSDAFDEIMRINVLGYLLAAQAAAAALQASRGAIVMTLSNASFYAAGGGALYTASKFAARGLVIQLAHEFAPRVRVNGVAIGGVRTGLSGPATLGLDHRSLADSFDRRGPGPNPYIPLHDSPTDPPAFTSPYVMLAAREESAMITGSIIRADGGISARGFYSAAQGDQQ